MITNDIKLITNEIHIWHASLDQPVSIFENLISTDEVKRAERFYFERDKKRFIARHGILRTILSYYLSIEPVRLQFNYGKHGKPELADTFDKGEIRFNLSHSDGLALYAFSRNRDVGIDVERIRDISDIEHITERFFSVSEYNVFCALPQSKKQATFFKCWTCKEAYLKAIGEGLSYPLDKFDISVVPGKPTRLLRINGDSKAATQWLIKDLKPAPGFAAAVAIKGRSSRVRNWYWPPELHSEN